MSDPVTSATCDIVVDAQLNGRTVAAVLRHALPGWSWSRVRRLCERGQVSVDGQVQRDSSTRVALDSRITVDSKVRPSRDSASVRVPLLHVDPNIAVIHKPAGVVSVPEPGGDKRQSLVSLVHTALRRYGGGNCPPPRVVHRLDRDTTGVMVFARNRRAERHLQQQFREHSIERQYVALAVGSVAAAQHDTMLLPDRGDGLRGSYKGRRAPPVAKRAITFVSPIEVLDIPEKIREPKSQVRQVTLVRCTLKTGRQHQIRIHLSEAGYPIVGEQVYVRDYGGGFVQGYAPGQGRPLLHAMSLGFDHPASDDPMRFVEPPAADFIAMLDALGAVQSPWTAEL